MNEDLYVLAMEGANIVLGIQWLETLGAVTCNYKKLTMEFQHQGKAVCLQGDTPLQISNGGLKSLMGREEIAYFCQLQANSTTIQSVSELWVELQDILEKFPEIMREPTGLPPWRPINHHILLNLGTKPINVHPYRYPHFQKLEIERLTKEMLSQGLIRHNVSPFSSPVLLVRKKDGTWRFCIDYRALNSATIHDHFPIPTMDELLDELDGSTIFSKIDLRVRYHQIRISYEDIEKIAFLTHLGTMNFQSCLSA